MCIYPSILDEACPIILRRCSVDRLRHLSGGGLPQWRLFDAKQVKETTTKMRGGSRGTTKRVVGTAQVVGVPHKQGQGYDH